MSSGGGKKYFFGGEVDMGSGAWYHGGMSNVHHNNEDEHFPCSCHRPEYAYTDSLCPECEDAAERQREARLCEEAREIGNALRAKELADRDAAFEEASRHSDMDAFADACGQMTREDWDADNDWLASAGWGEM